MEPKTPSKNRSQRTPLSPSAAGVTVRRRRRARKPDGDNFDEVQIESGYANVSSDRGVSGKNLSSDVAQFQKSALATSQASFWSKPNGNSLIKHAVSASTSLSQKKDVSQSSSSSLLLEDCSTELLSSCRALVKEASEEDKKQCESTVKADPTRFCRAQYNRLYVSIHGLRALLSTQLLNDGIKRDAILRLLYFCVVTASSPTSIDSSKDAKHLCCASYHALALVLQNYTLVAKDAAFKCKRTFDASKPNMNYDMVFPTPLPVKTKSTVHQNSTDADQICTMCISATLGLARMMLRLAQDVSRNDENCDGNHVSFIQISDPIAVLRYLISDIAVSWIVCMVQICCVAKKTESQHLSSILSNCKKAHRILVDAADTIQDDVEGRLRLQIDAVRALLLNQNVDASTLVPDVSSERSVFAMACTFAWKVAESANMKLRRDDSTKKLSYSLMQEFHNPVGALFDSFVADLETYPMSYVEYCAYRALHTKGQDPGCTRDTCIFRGLHYIFHHSCSSKRFLDYRESFMVFFFLNCQLRRSLERLISNPLAHSVEFLPFEEDYIMDAFRLHFVDGNEVDGATRLRFYNLLSSLSFHRIVYQILQEFQDKELPLEHLRTSAQILSDCIGPFYIGLLRHIDEKHRRQLWLTMTSCFQQAISVFELCDNTCFERSNKYSEELVRVLLNVSGSDVKPPPDCNENIAKFLYSVGKKRFESGSKLDALLPLLYSIKLFIRAVYPYNPSSISTHKISKRFALIASIYKSLGMVDEAIISFLSALLFDAVEESLDDQPNDNPSVSLFSWLASRTESVIDIDKNPTDSSKSEFRIGLQNSYISLFLKRRKVNRRPKISCEDKSLKIMPSETIDLLLDSLKGGNSYEGIEQNCLFPFNFGTLLISAFSPQAMSTFQQSIQGHVEFELLKIVMDMVIRVGGLLQRKDNEQSAVMLSDHTDLCWLAESLLKSKVIALNLEVVGAMMKIVASVSLVSNHIYVRLESMLLNHAQKFQQKPALFIDLATDYAMKAKSILRKALEKNVDLDPILFVVDLSLDVYRYQLSCMYLKPTKSFQLNMKQIQTFIQHTKITSSANTSFGWAWTQCLITSLSKLCGLFLLEGEGLTSLQLAKWNFDAFCTSQNDNAEGFLWFKSMLLSLTLTNSVAAIADFENVTCSSPFEALIQACRLRLFIRALTDDSRLSVSRNQFLHILEGLNESGSTRETELLFVNLWTRSTIFLGLSECMERQGYLQRSSEYLKRCFDVCKDLSANMKRYNATLPLGVNSYPFWMKLYCTFITLSCSERQIECLHRTASIQSRLGNHRLSVEYSFAALMSPALEAAGFEVKNSFAESVYQTRNLPVLNSREARCRRMFLRFKSKASPIEFVTDVFRGHKRLSLSTVDGNVGSGDCLVNLELEQIFDLYEIVDMMNGYQAFPSLNDDMNLNKTATREFVRHRLAPHASKLYDNLETVAGCREQPYLQLQYDAKLKDASVALSDDCLDTLEDSVTATGWLHDIISAPNCDPLCRAWSYYLHGSFALKSARRNGDIYRRWNDMENSADDSQYLGVARTNFENALSLLGSSCDILKRNLLRSLALVIGPGTSHKDEAIECFRLINASVAGSIKGQMLGLMRGSEDCDNNVEGAYLHSLADILGSLGNTSSKTKGPRSTDSFLLQLGKVVPKGWRFVTAVLCPTGEMLLSSLMFSEVGDPVFHNAIVDAHSFDQTGLSPELDMYDFIVKRLKEIIHRSQDQLAEDGGTYMDESSKQDHTRKWWNTRKNVDSDLQQHLENVEQVILLSNNARRVLFGLSADSDLCDFANESLHSTCGNLTSRFDAVSMSTETSFPANSTFTRGSKKESCTTAQQSTRDISEMVPDQSFDNPTNECIFLILDESLLVFPFEGFHCFEGKAVCRIPSLPFALFRLSMEGVERCQPRNIQPEKTSYILDPESNLAGTKERLIPFIDSLQDKYKNRWRGVVGAVPSIDFMEEALSLEDGLLLYFGHGGGQQFFSRAKIESLGRRSGSSLASLILMGCGSGRLESVNTKKSKSMSKPSIHYEPEGISLSYLLAGSPCVVGNLWDVTDRDIDRYAMTLVESIFDDHSCNKSIAKCVAESRAACKMRYIVGCAPVCYGFPVNTPN